MGRYVLQIQDTDRTMVALVGGKSANLGELLKMREIQVPAGFCMTTEAYKKITEGNRQFEGLLRELNGLTADRTNSIGAVSARIRTAIEITPIPSDIAAEVRSYLTAFGENEAFAVRSSATAEDLPTASFAGQLDTFLNITGADDVLRHISKCWSSLFTERAVVYRLLNGFDHRNVRVAVIVQQMISPEAAGVLFTADPLTGNRKISSVDATFGLGEALVSGLVNPDTYKVRTGTIIGRSADQPRRDSTAQPRKRSADQPRKPVLTDEQILRLEQTGRIIEAHFGSPQDIEWCLADNKFFIVQSRPITTLYPVPNANDADNHVYVSVGHQQMMTDAMTPLGLSLWQLIAFRPMSEAGGRLFIDVTQNLISPAGRTILLDIMAQHDPLIKDALATLIERGDFLTTTPGDNGPPAPGNNNTAVAPPEVYLRDDDYPAIIGGLIADSRSAIEALQENISKRSGPAVFDFILEDISHLKKSLADSKSMEVIRTAIDASRWLNEKMNEWLGETNVADTLSQSASNNITAEMGLALLDVADTIRPYPEIIEYLQQANNHAFLAELPRFKGGQEAKAAIDEYLLKYGMRCPGEIDITKARWAEQPAALLPLILSNVRNFAPGAGQRKFEEGRQQALNKEEDLLDRLKLLPDGEQKAHATRKTIGLLRDLIGYREYPKYQIVNHCFAYRQALLREARQLAIARVIPEAEDVYYLCFDEFREVVRTHRLDNALIDERKAQHKRFDNLTPPRVITSDGEVVTGRYMRSDLPTEAIPGLPVSAGVIEGRARVLFQIQDAELEPGDILVTRFTDPSWTPLFVSISGLVTEVGGLMTHGAVIAREYGLPAVVGVENATRLVRDGQWIRVNGTQGYIQLL